MEKGLDEFYVHAGGRHGRTGRCRDCIRETRRDSGEYQRRYYQANRERIKTRAQEWREENREKARADARQYLKDHPEVARASRHRRRARLRDGIVIYFTSEQLDQRMSMFGHRCWMCGGPFESVDHVKPLVAGGPHCLSNLRPACRSCNSRKQGQWH